MFALYPLSIDLSAATATTTANDDDKCKECWGSFPHRSASRVAQALGRRPSSSFGSASGTGAAKDQPNPLTTEYGSQSHGTVSWARALSLIPASDSHAASDSDRSGTLRLGSSISTVNFNKPHPSTRHQLTRKPQLLGSRRKTMSLAPW